MSESHAPSASGSSGSGSGRQKRSPDEPTTASGPKRHRSEKTSEQKWAEEQDLDELEEADVAGFSLDQLGALSACDDILVYQDLLQWIERYRFAKTVALHVHEIQSVKLADEVIQALTAYASLDQTVRTQVQARRAALQQPHTSLTAELTEAIWQQLADKQLASAQVTGEKDCEYRAHAVCELIQHANPGLAANQLVKCWALRGTNRLQATVRGQQILWNQHVAAGLLDGQAVRVLDPLLFNQPVALDAWAQAVHLGNGQSLQAPWEVLGRPMPDDPLSTLCWWGLTSLERQQIDDAKAPAPQ